jgi:hypothetical protein
MPTETGPGTAVEGSPLAGALRRLESGVAALEAACTRLAESDRGRARRDRESRFMAEDRARLGEALDDAASRAAEAEATRREVAARLDRAIETVRAVLADPAAE